MKKMFAVALAMLLVAGFAMPSFAKSSKEQKFDKIIAKVVSLDAAAKTMVVKDEKSGATRTITISAKAASQINVGDRVRIKLKPGTDMSAGVRVLKDHSKDAMDASMAADSAKADAAAAPAEVTTNTVMPAKK